MAKACCVHLLRFVFVEYRVCVQPTTANLSKYATLDAEIEHAAKVAEAVAVRQGGNSYCCAGCGRRLQIKQPGVLL